jgi:hypothetical protein
MDVHALNRREPVLLQRKIVLKRFLERHQDAEKGKDCIDALYVES